MEKKLITAMALSFLVLLLFQKISKPPIAEQAMMHEQPRTAAVSEGAVKAETVEPSIPKQGLKENTTTIETDKFVLVFSDIGGSLKELALKEYVSDGKEEIIIETEDPSKRIFALRSPSLSGLDYKRFRVEQGDNYLKYTFTQDGTTEIVKRYDFRNASDYIELSVFIKNLSRQEEPFSFDMTGPSELQKSDGAAGRSFLEAAAMLDKELVKVKSTKGLDQRSGLAEWIALKNRYFTVVLRPENNVNEIFFNTTADKSLETGIISDKLTLKPGETLKSSYLFYAGPVSEQRLVAFGGYDIQKIVDYGFFGAISKTLLVILRFFHKGTKNWGLAIILLTFLINMVLFPLTRKSFVSMQQMKKIQPHMAKLKELHKDNPQKLNKEMMELYKTYNVNPLGGCLPLLLQMPIFISLYQGLMKSVELKGAKFLWIKDLASPDAVPLPFSLPVVGNHINILPLLMAGMMVVQQKLTQGASSDAMPADQASQQKMMMVFMPILFGFMFYNMPAGLVLYWLTNTILMSAEQGFISKQLAGS